MSAALDSIWDLPVENSPTRRSPPSKRSSLFLDSGSEDEAPKTSAAPESGSKSGNKALIDAMFDDLDDDDPGFAPALDMDALRREAEAKLASQRSVLPSSSPPPEGIDDGEEGSGKKGGKSKRKPIPRLDETLLLSSDGFPALMKEAKKFKPKGKGHEARTKPHLILL